MSNDIIEVLNLETGARGQIRRKWFDNPVINAGILVEADDEQKPYVPELFKSKVDQADDEEDDSPVYDELADAESKDEDE